MRSPSAEVGQLSEKVLNGALAEALPPRKESEGIEVGSCACDDPQTDITPRTKAAAASVAAGFQAEVLETAIKAASPVPSSGGTSGAPPSLPQQPDTGSETGDSDGMDLAPLDTSAARADLQAQFAALPDKLSPAEVVKLQESIDRLGMEEFAEGAPEILRSPSLSYALPTQILEPEREPGATTQSDAPEAPMWTPAGDDLEVQFAELAAGGHLTPEEADDLAHEIASLRDLSGAAGPPLALDESSDTGSSRPTTSQSNRPTTPVATGATAAAGVPSLFGEQQQWHQQHPDEELALLEAELATLESNGMGYNQVGDNSNTASQESASWYQSEDRGFDTAITDVESYLEERDDEVRCWLSYLITHL